MLRSSMIYAKRLLGKRFRIASRGSRLSWSCRYRGCTTPNVLLLTATCLIENVANQLKKRLKNRFGLRERQSREIHFASSTTVSNIHLLLWLLPLILLECLLLRSFALSLPLSEADRCAVKTRQPSTSHIYDGNYVLFDYV